MTPHGKTKLMHAMMLTSISTHQAEHGLDDATMARNLGLTPAELQAWSVSGQTTLPCTHVKVFHVLAGGSHSDTTQNGCSVWPEAIREWLEEPRRRLTTRDLSALLLVKPETAAAYADGSENWKSHFDLLLNSLIHGDGKTYVKFWRMVVANAIAFSTLPTVQAGKILGRAAMQLKPWLEDKPVNSRAMAQIMGNLPWLLASAPGASTIAGKSCIPPRAYANKDKAKFVSPSPLRARLWQFARQENPPMSWQRVGTALGIDKNTLSNARNKKGDIKVGDVRAILKCIDRYTPTVTAPAPPASPVPAPAPPNASIPAAAAAAAAAAQRVALAEAKVRILRRRVEDLLGQR